VDDFEVEKEEGKKWEENCHEVSVVEAEILQGK
jgi:hypothetical protein